MERILSYHVEPVPRSLMAAFVAAHHYAVRMPPLRDDRDAPAAGNDLAAEGLPPLRPPRDDPRASAFGEMTPTGRGHLWNLVHASRRRPSGQRGAF